MWRTGGLKNFFYNLDRKVTEEVAEELKRKMVKFLKNSLSIVYL